MEWIAILLAALVNIIVGWIYFSCFFGKQFVDLAKISPDSKDKLPQYIAAAFIAALVMSWVLSLVVHHFGAPSFKDGAIVGFLMWLGFVATTYFSEMIWQQRPLKLFLLLAGNMLITLILMGGIIASF